MIIGNDHGENYNFSNKQEIKQSVKWRWEAWKKELYLQVDCTQVVKVDTQPTDI